MHNIELDRLRTALEHAQAVYLSSQIKFQSTLRAGEVTGTESTLENILDALRGLNAAHERYEASRKEYTRAIHQRTAQSA